MSVAQNPILPGFHPDPSIVRVGHDYYIATSTFEWFPGVAIHHSTDLVHWKLLTYPLTRTSQLDMHGCRASCGVWAPCLSYSQGTFYLIYTNVRHTGGIYKDTPNYLVTAPSIEGPWSEPIYLNSSGFDPSLFHDTDGKKWLVNQLMDYRCWKNTFGGIVLQEYSEKEKKLIGQRKLIFRGTSLGCTEGPHLYKHNGFYYLICAEGGTGYEHAVTVARSRQIDGPYEVSPNHPILSSYHKPQLNLQKSGHASLCDSTDGHWYLVHLCSRPLAGTNRCILGRETALQEVCWKNDWLQLKNGTDFPADQVIIDDTDTDSVPVNRDLYEEFENSTWDLSLQTLREPLDKRASLSDRFGWLRLYGADSLASNFEKSILAHRQQCFDCSVTTKLDFFPENYQQLAGLTYYYDELCNYALFITRDEQNGRVLTLISTILGKETQPIGMGIQVPENGSIWLKICIHNRDAQFYYSTDGLDFSKIGPVLDASVLSDDIYKEIGTLRFTGAFIAISCHDLAGKSAYADFDFYHYEEN